MKTFDLRLRLLTSSVLGLSALALSTAAHAQAVEEIVVTGRRVSEASVAIGTDKPTATVAITEAALLSAPAGITGLKMLESLPGFNVQANDALGMYEFGNSVSVRAFNFQQIGFLLDNIPMGRSDQFGGSPIYRYVDNENLARVEASSGAGDVALPSYSSLGPIVSYLSKDPAKEMGGTAGYTMGSQDLKRSFIRLETGEHAGLSAVLSRSKIDGDLWRGAGTIEREHWEGKVRYAFTEDTSLTFQFVDNDYFDYDSPSITKAQYNGTANDAFGRSGRYFAYLSVLPAPTGPLAPLATAPGIAYSNALFNQYYKQAINSRQDQLFGLTLASQITPDLKFTATGYYEDKQGYGVSPEAYATSLTNYNAERLIVPYEAVTGFFDPSVKFGLKFEAADAATGQESAAEKPAAKGKAKSAKKAETEATPAAEPARIGRKPTKAPTAEAKPEKADTVAAEGSDGNADEPAKPAGTAEVVSLDAFRKKK